MARFLKWLLIVPVAAIVLALAVANRHTATIYLDPFPGGVPDGPQITAPFYLVLLLILMFGVLIGGVATWLRQGSKRREARRTRAELRRAHAELARNDLLPAIEHRKSA